LALLAKLLSVPRLWAGLRAPLEAGLPALLLPECQVPRGAPREGDGKNQKIEGDMEDE
jgi:hypothetical protein